MAALAAVSALVAPLLLAGCGGEGDEDQAAAMGAQSVPSVGRAELESGGTVRWAVDALPATLNTFQPDADRVTDQVAGAVLPMLFTVDATGRPQLNTDYLSSAEITEREPKQTVVYTLNPDATWSDGEKIGVADFVAQWQALRGENEDFRPARNAGYERVENVRKGPEPGQVEVVFAQPYADWRALFSPLYPRSLTTDAKRFNEDSRTELPVSGGPFTLAKVDEKAATITLERNDRWWGDPALLDSLELVAVEHGERRAALAAGTLDVAEIAPADAEGLAPAHGGPPAADDKPASEGTDDGEGMNGLAVHRAYDAAYTQLALNGTSGPLADERVRWAIARAVDRAELAEDVHTPAGLPVKPLGSHLRMLGQDGYRDNSDALGESGAESAAELLDEAGWQQPAGPAAEDGKPGAAVAAPLGAGWPAAEQRAALLRQAAGAQRAQGLDEPADATEDDAAEAAAEAEELADRAAMPVRTRDGAELRLRFVLPDGPGAEQLRDVAGRIGGMLATVGIRVDYETVAADAFFADHIQPGDFDLTLYSWPATAYPATDARPLFAKPRPAPGGELTVEQNYTRVGTDYIDQLLDQAAGELDEEEQEELLNKADAHIWAAAGSIPLYQRPQLVAARDTLSGAGAYGLATPRYQDIGYRSATRST
ncbi:ABC transporter family substrate-binding protein [Streptomyces millisiae]|uniref:ABC transporter family substrate-binding protein n=1 Tax=Streptomyces millisiae TaxID=3075542 RepID=A0ABU2LVR3_9ACTN|nr:ABC transporter family substrate-binding protein [Streptomyces sp. DSM 44918]MDT0321669.1 ABC transporter family substrate-binding protein [Streptomyces sp. DSM 44918]